MSLSAYLGTRSLLCSENNGIWCVIIHYAGDKQPLLVAMNVGDKPVFDYSLKIPNKYGNFSSVEMLIATSGGLIQVVGKEMQIHLPGFTFILAKLLKPDCIHS